jgi:hypothetical protein
VQGRPIARLAVALTVAAALAAFAAPAPGNHLDDFEPVEPSCRYLEAGAPGPADNKLEVDLGNYESVEIERVESRIRVNELDYNTHREIVCDYGKATVHNTDSIVLIAPSSADPFFFDAGLSIDLQDGLLEPGATPEADGSEIELTMVGAGILASELSLITPNTEDQVRATTTDNATQINLNAGETTQDIDLDLPPVLFGAIYSGGGDDVVVSTTKLKSVRSNFPLGLGVLGEGGNDLIKANQAYGGDGDDNLVGGAETDYLIGGRGSDAVRGKNSTDLIVSAGGRDLLLSGGGDDIVLAADGNGDKVRCGDGRDRAYVDYRDKRSGCERLRRIKGASGADDDAFSPFKVRLRTRSGKPVL